MIVNLQDDARVLRAARTHFFREPSGRCARRPAAKRCRSRIGDVEPGSAEARVARSGLGRIELCGRAGLVDVRDDVMHGLAIAGMNVDRRNVLIGGQIRWKREAAIRVAGVGGVYVSGLCRATRSGWPRVQPLLKSSGGREIGGIAFRRAVVDPLRDVSISACEMTRGSAKSPQPAPASMAASDASAS